MSIESELVSTEGNIVKAYDSLNKLGETATDKNIQNISELVDNIYAKFPKTEYQEGTEVNLGKTSKGKLDYEDGKVGIGQSSQDSTQGYNLLPPASYSAYTSMGVTHKSNGDGTYVLNGTSTGTSAVNYTIEPYTIKSGDYLFIGNDVIESNFALALLRSNDEQIAFKAGSQVNAMLSLENYVGDTIGKIRTFVNSGVTCSNYKIKPMIISGSTAKLFELYSGGYASPSPNWKQKVEYAAGKNMFKDGITFQTSSSNWSDQLGTSTTTVAQIKLNSNYYDLEANTPYTFKLNSYANIDYLQVVYLDENDTIKALMGYSDFTNSKTFSSAEPLRVWIRARVTNGNTDTYFIGQLEKGTQATPYLPYNTIEEVVSGKNILGSEIELGGFNDDGTPLSGTSTYRNATPIPVKPNKQYVFSINGTAKNINKFYYDRNMNLISKESNVYPLITTPNNAYYLNIYKGVADGDQKWQIVEGTEANTYTLTYEPYITPKSYQLSLGDKKLYDECYIVGSPDNWKFVDNYEKILFKNNVTGTQSTTGGGTRFVVSTPHNAKPTTSGGAVADIYSNILSKTSADETYLKTNGIAINSGGVVVFFWEDFVNYTLSQVQNYFANRDDYIVYPLATPIETPITDETLISQLNAWYNAQSTNGTTIITSNGDLPLIVRVRGLKGE